MGLNVGGIYVKRAGKLTPNDVQAAVRDYWLANGATESKEDPLRFEPLGLQKTGKLGFVVVAARGAAGRWIGVYDSERYTADSELAAHLARRFRTEVWHYEITSAADGARARRYGGAAKVVRGEDSVLALIDAFPYAFLYYDKIEKELPAKERARFLTLGFERIPQRPDKAYTGPGAAQHRSNDAVAQARLLAGQRDAAGLRRLASKGDVYWDVIRPAVEDADLSESRDARFVHALGTLVVREEGHSREVAEAALRVGDEALFEKAMALAKLETFEADLVERRAFELGQAGQSTLAFRLLEAVTRAPTASATQWNNAAHFLHLVLQAQKRGHKQTGISAERLERFIAGAMNQGRVNSSIFHNLACALVELGRRDEALAAVEAAARSAYAHVARMKTDRDLDPIRRDPRFQAAFRAERKPISIAGLSVERGRGKSKARLIAPAFGLHFYFEGARAAPAIAGVIESLAAEFPRMFDYFRPSGVLALQATRRGKLKRDLTLLRKRPAEIELQYDRARGAACDQRVLVNLGADSGGELSIYLPLSLADDADALFARCLGYARDLPFETGNAGFTLTPYDVGPLAGPSTDADVELWRLLPEHLGLTASQTKFGFRIDATFVVPSWLTFLGPKALKRAGSRLKGAIGPATIAALPNKRAVIRAARAPFVGPAGAPTDLGALPKVVRALHALLPRAGKEDEGTYAKLEADRMRAIVRGNK
ncbi:MAG TPA: type VI immunity family protein [Polyangia bacterium]|nr:type VI immunity family protein [Polyangia bacterium]